MATSGRVSGMVGYNVQSAVDAEHHLLVAHDVIMTGSDRQQLSSMAAQAKDALGVEALDVLADRGYFSGEETRRSGRLPNGPARRDPQRRPASRGWRPHP
jgi:transposase